MTLRNGKPWVDTLKCLPVLFWKKNLVSTRTQHSCTSVSGLMYVNSPTGPEMTKELNSPFTLIYVYICMNAFAMGNMWWSEGVLPELVLSFLGLRDETEVTRLGGKWFYTPSHLTGQIL